MDLLVGRIGRPHGVRGDVTIEVRTDDPASRFAVGAVLRTDPADRGPLTIVAARRSSQLTVLSFEGVTDRGEAEALRDTLLVVDTADLPEVDDPDEFYDHQLIGLQVRHVDGTRLGTVADVLHPPAAPVLVITAPAGSGAETADDSTHESGQAAKAQDVLVPFVRAIVPTVDLAGGYLIIDPPDGMFGPEAV